MVIAASRLLCAVALCALWCGVVAAEAPPSGEVEAAKKKAQEANVPHAALPAWWDSWVLANATALLQALEGAGTNITAATTAAGSAKESDLVSDLVSEIERVKVAFTAANASATRMKTAAEELNKTMEEAAKKDGGVKVPDDLSNKEKATELEKAAEAAALGWDVVLHGVVLMLRSAEKVAADVTSARVEAEAGLEAVPSNPKEKDKENTNLKGVTDALTKAITFLKTSETKAQDVKSSAKAVHEKVTATINLWKETEELAGKLHKTPEERMQEMKKDKFSGDSSRLPASHFTAPLVPFILFVCAATTMVVA